MCTLTYIPVEKNNFYLTQNRDESPKRAANGIIQHRLGKEQLLFPQDIGAGGTWIAASEGGRLVALLNGAFLKHQHQPPYRRSRGLMVLDFFAFSSAKTFFQQYIFEEMEPFTMVVYEAGKLFEFRWDEKRKHLRELDASQPHLWASATLYPEPVQQKRQQWFSSWMKEKTKFDPTSILHFHKTAGDGDPLNDLVMNRSNIVCTTSITMIHFHFGQLNMQYHDLLQQQSHYQSGGKNILVATDKA